ncbi:MAG: DUF4440 domain-containing protein [Rhodobacteraceae bacterium GWE1_64_9]|nr:MAG: DUF4440 domain-containing protein [Rhodobacteraceae bacterium GWE1_64_9]OHC47698.1 MAG: DUF4440 domain-containing protein [Rhodobacteraceae bacterium GWF1_65_7]HBD89935.1 DUF4440 domain-containing protein [Gemmobacter sp.]HBU15051.1 DUF4440 domain-containing protein [Gemmobacter sp.]
MEPEDFARQFAILWSRRDVQGLAAMMTGDADMLTLTGVWAEGQKAILAALDSEFSGIFSRARLVTGRAKARRINADTAVLHQRFVLSGLVDAEGNDMGRIGALLVATLTTSPQGWQAVALQFCATEG